MGAHDGRYLDRLATHASQVRRIGIVIPSYSSLDILHRLAESAVAVSDNEDAELLPPLFPLLETLVVRDYCERVIPNVVYTPEAMALTNAIVVRKQAGMPLKEILVSKSLEGWSVRDPLRDEIKITFVSKSTKE